MRRRALLSLLGTASVGSLAGCSAPISQLATPDVASATIEARDRTCSERPDETATIVKRTDDGTGFEIEGTIAVPEIRHELHVAVQDGVGRKDRDDAAMEIRIDFSPSDPRSQTDVPSCEGEIAYLAEIELTKPPSKLIVRHVVEEEDAFTLKTMTSETLTWQDRVGASLSDATPRTDRRQ